MLNERKHRQRVDTVWFHLREGPGEGTFTGTERSRMVFPGRVEAGEGGMAVTV